MLEEIEMMGINNGFASNEEMFSLISEVDISDQEKLNKFEKWQEEDESKKGLINILNSQLPNFLICENCKWEGKHYDLLENEICPVCKKDAICSIRFKNKC